MSAARQARRSASLQVREGVELRDCTTLQVGGPARAWVDAGDSSAVVEALEWASARGLPVVVMGGGSNVVVADRRIDALVLRPSSRGLLVRERGGEVHLLASAGLELDRLVEWAVDHGLAGIECLSGIPGSVGAAPVQNVGAYGQELGDVVESVHVVDRRTGMERVLTAPRCGFGYRTSTFKGDQQDALVVVALALTLRRAPPRPARYPELARALERGGGAVSLEAVRTAVLELRRGKSMLLEPIDVNARSVGSFFVNPTLDTTMLDSLRERVASRLGSAARLPEHPGGAGRVKVPAAWLIERAGMPPGWGDGRVGLSAKHTLAIVNRGGATAAEVLAFASLVRERVFDSFGVKLALEPRLVGFEPHEIAHLSS
jgi:UDP-N-acetylmuramate dehydrogenase